MSTMLSHKQFKVDNVNDRESVKPAFTFKISNTLILLEEGLINDQFEVIKWDGQDREFTP